MENQPTGPPTLPTEPSNPQKPSSDQNQNPEPTKNGDQTNAAATDKAVDEIVKSESDALLAAEDQALLPNTLKLPKSLLAKLAAPFVWWWHNHRVRRLSLLGLGSLLGILLLVPPTRYLLLNTAGVRVSASVQVIDDATQQPLKKVKITLGGQSALTNDEGRASLTRLKQGRRELVVEKRAFAHTKRTITLGWGSNPLGKVSVIPTGEQYKFTVHDFLSNRPVVSAEATSGEAGAQANDEGQIVLVIEANEESDQVATIAAAGYRSETVTLNEAAKNSQTIKLVPAQKDIFISKRSGKYDVYSIYVDGKNEQLLLAGTGTEREDSVLAVSPSGKFVALVSTRGNNRNQDGFLLSVLTIINTESREITEIAKSERVQLIDWFGERLVYARVAQGASASDPKRQRIMSYDTELSDNRELAASNYFNDILSAGGRVFYAPSSYLATSGTGLFAINADGSNQQTVFAQEVWNILRTDYEHLVLSLQQEWYDYVIGSSGGPQKASGQPNINRSRVYADSFNKKYSLWVDERDGKGVLLAYDPASKTDKVLHSQSGLKRPVRWLSDNTVVYRASTPNETADYAISMDGGEPVKVRDVTPTGGIDTWYYY